MPLTQQLRTAGSSGFDRATFGQSRAELAPLADPALVPSQARPAEGLRPNAFFDLLANGVQSVNDAQHHADDQVHALLTGGNVTQAEVLTSVQKADMAFRLLLQVRNKLMAAYEELNSIRV